MRMTHIAAAATLGLVMVAASAATAGSGRDDDARTKLFGYEEVPSISTPGGGRFDARVQRDSVRYTLSYGKLSAPVTQAHIHFGQFSVNGGVSVFLCSNGDAPSGTPSCPPSGEVRGTLTAADVIGPAAQGIAPGELEELIAAIDAGVAYVNVHTTAFPTGEIRGQLDEDDDDGDDDDD